MLFNDFVAYGAISFGVLFLISQVAAVFLMRRNAKKDKSSSDFNMFLNLVILPSLCILYGGGYLFYKVADFFSFLTLPFNKEAQKAWKDRKRHKAEQKEFESLSTDEIMFRGTRMSIERNLGYFNDRLKTLAPDSSWEDARVRNILPENINIVFQHLIDASIEFSLMEVSPVCVKEDISKERRLLETAYESMKSVLIEYKLLEEERAEQFMIDEINVETLAFSVEASESIPTDKLRNTAYDYFHASRLLRGEPIDHL